MENNFRENNQKLAKTHDTRVILKKHKVKLHKPIPSDTIEKSQRTIFMWNLNPSFFFCYTTEDGPETLEQKMDQMTPGP